MQVAEIKRILVDDYARQRVQVRRRAKKGFCLFATKNIPMKSPICEYKGSLMTRKEAESQTESYVFDFTYKGRAMSIDATDHVETLGRFINHDRDSPNAVAQKLDDLGDGRPHIIIFALRDIAAGEEVAYEYGDFSKASLEQHAFLGKPCLKAASKVWKNKPS